MSLMPTMPIMRARAKSSSKSSRRRVRSRLTFGTKCSFTKLTLICSWMTTKRLSVSMLFRQICEVSSKSSDSPSLSPSNWQVFTITRSTSPSPRSCKSFYPRSPSSRKWWTPWSIAQRSRRHSYLMWSLRYTSRRIQLLSICNIMRSALSWSTCSSMSLAFTATTKRTDQSLTRSQALSLDWHTQTIKKTLCCTSEKSTNV